MLFVVKFVYPSEFQTGKKFILSYQVKQQDREAHMKWTSMSQVWWHKPVVSTAQEAKTSRRILAKTGWIPRQDSASK